MATIGIKDAIENLNRIDSNSEKVAKSLVKDFEQRGKPWIQKPVTQHYNIKAKEFKGYIQKGKTQGVNLGGRVVEARAYEVKSGMLGPSTARFNMTPKQAKSANITRRRKSSKQPYTVTTGNYKLSATIVKGQKKVLGRYINRKGTSSALADKSPIMLFPTLNGHAGQREGSTIKKIKSISAAQMVENDEVSEQIQKNIQDNIEKRYEHYKSRFLD